jgi:DNA-binding transcriptional ArsR family regulator
MMKSAQVVKALSALAQPTRLAIYRLLVERGTGGMVAGQIAEKLKVSPATLSFHLKKFSHAGLLESRQAGLLRRKFHGDEQHAGIPDRKLLWRKSSGLHAKQEIIIFLYFQGAYLARQKIPRAGVMHRQFRTQHFGRGVVQ